VPSCARRGTRAAQGIQPATGDVVYDQFEDGVFRTELETRVAHLRPTELLRPPVLSRPTERFLAHWIAQGGDAGSGGGGGGDGVRVERLKRDHPEYAKALVAVTEFLRQADTDASRLVADVSTLPRGVLAALASLLAYLREFGLERSLRLTSNFAPFASRRTIVLSANTLRNLELLQNDTDGQVYGSLLWVLDHTRTPMGKRLLRKWVAQPLRNREDVEARLDAVAELAQVHARRRASGGRAPRPAARLTCFRAGLSAWDGPAAGGAVGRAERHDAGRAPAGLAARPSRPRAPAHPRPLQQGRACARSPIFFRVEGGSSPLTSA